SASSNPAAPQATATALATHVNGGGQATLTDPDGNTFPLALGLAAVLRADGTAHGTINFVFGPAFSQLWGAVPGVDTIRLSGAVTAITVAEDGTVSLEGLTTEKDYARGGGIAFVEENIPFRIVLHADSGQFALQWCELPTFELALSDGNLALH